MMSTNFGTDRICVIYFLSLNWKKSLWHETILTVVVTQVSIFYDGAFLGSGAIFNKEWIITTAYNVVG